MLFLFFTACADVREFNDDDYELIVSDYQHDVLVLFPCNNEHTKAEAAFLKDIRQEGITTLLLDYNRKLWLSESEKHSLSERIIQILDSNKVVNENIYLKGFSGGGNSSFLLANYLKKTISKINVNGVLVVDAPLDLERLYLNSKVESVNSIHESSYSESIFVINLIESNLGNPANHIDNFRKLAPFLISSHDPESFSGLADLKILLFTEPALDWQQSQRNRVYENTNAFTLEKVYHSLIVAGHRNIQFTQTENKGFNSRGKRHPHS